MRYISEETYNKIYEIFDGQMLSEDIEKWINSYPLLEKEMGSRSYLDLIMLDYRRTGVLQNVRNILQEYVEPSAFLEWKVRRLLCSIIDGKIEVYTGLVQLAKLYYDNGIAVLGNFAYLESAMEDAYSEGQTDIPDELKVELLSVDWKTVVVNHSRQFLQELDEGKIKIEVIERR